LGLITWIVLFGIGTAVLSQSDHATSLAGPGETTSSASPVSSPAASSAAATATPTPITHPSASITIQDPLTTSINYLHDVPGKMTGFKPGEEAVWILAIIPGDTRVYPQGECDITGKESFRCVKTQFGNPGGKGTFYAQAIIVNASQQKVLQRHYS